MVKSIIHGTAIVTSNYKLKKKDTHSIQILVVDDEEEICILLAYALGKLGYKVDYSLTLKDGYDKLKKLKPDIVLLDLHLPDGSGFSMIPQIKKSQSTFLVISAYDDGKEHALLSGASTFIKKPFSIQTITQAISDMNKNGLT